MLVRIDEKTYDGKHQVLKDIEVNFPKGQTTLIIGTSGAGKSTLIKCLVQKTSFDGEISEGSLNQKQLISKIAYIPQHPALNRMETVEQSVYWTARLDSLTASSAALAEKAESCIEAVGIGHVRKNKISTLSGGQMQRVAIAKELIRNKDIIIADEIDTGLDCGVARSLCLMLRNIAHYDNKTVIVISHNLTNIDLYDRVVVLVKDSAGTGRIAYQGSPGNLKSYFGVNDYVDILMKLNSQAEGGQGKADYYINKLGSGVRL